MITLPTTANRTAALGAQERQPCTVLELTVDRCANTYGVAPCTATGAVGSECYNTYETCQAKSTYVKTTQTMRFVSRSVMSPPGQDLRPYLLGSISAPSMLDFEAGLAPRNNVAVNLADEPDNDSSQDPYYATRATPAGGTYWARWLARNRNYFGRMAKLRKGFVASPWDWTLFLDELYIIDSIAMQSNGQVKITLKDPLKLTDNNTIPLPTSGAILADLKNIENTGVAQAGGSNTITLASTASAVDGYYVGMEVYIYANTGAGQRGVVSSYVGATRVATISTTWAVNPDTTSAYQVSALSLNVGAGLGAQYTDPATSGKNEYVRIDGELIRYTSKSGDVLSWPDSTYRAQFGSIRADHSANASVQLCRAYINQSVQAVLTALLTESGIASGYIGTSLADECATWYGTAFNITACISAPEQASTMIAEILQQIGAVMWWSPQTQKVEFKAVMPNTAAFPTWDDQGSIIQNSLSLQLLDNLRITESAISYALRDATANLSEPRSFQRTDVIVNTNAESINEYGDVRPEVITSRWFGTANYIAMQSAASRRVNRLYNPPKQFALKIDPKDYTLPIGATVAIKSWKNVDYTGQPKAELCIINQINDAGTHVEVQARSTNFAKKYAFIAPPGQPDYTLATDAQKQYAYIAGAGQLMSDGSQPSRII